MSDATRELSLNAVKDAICGQAAAFRSITEYEPAGGPGDTVFPPTYEGGKYALVGYREEEGTNRKRADRVILDSVQSQANRMELALLDAWERKQISIPVITVDFANQGLAKVLRISSLEAPHRIADALLRDSLTAEGIEFRKSSIGKVLDDVDARNATALFELCPTSLVFGMWDSAGPRGGLGAKFARAMVSEIVGLDVQIGVRTSSRLDPAQIMLQAGPLFKTTGGGWTLDPAEAITEKKLPVKVGKEGKPSEANHGNVTPSLKDGGVTIRTAVQSTVLSLPALRRLRFPIDGKWSPERDDAGRTALAALGLCAATLIRESGCDLRSRCLLFPTGEITWALLDQPGREHARFTLSGAQARQLLEDATIAAKKAGLSWMDKELLLTPSPQLVQLIKNSQNLATKTDGGTDA
jgi:CRISPR-associated protein Csb1